MSKLLLKFDPLEEGTLIKRYKRFLADIRLDDGRKITAHCPNTGPMKGLLTNNSKVRVKFCPSPKRKLQWTWEQVQVVNYKSDQIWVGINTLLANKLIKNVIENNILKEFIGDIDLIKSERPYGKDNKSRIDFLLTPKSSNPDNRNIYIEVKNTTWIKKNIALFPDTVTLRGQKHLKDLMSIIPESKAILVPCITRNDVDFFSTGDDEDPKYGELFSQSLKLGLIVIPCRLNFYRDHINWDKIVPVLRDKDDK
tara:strand:+ start:822 stop:1580 length:759 start_codon:yes stop_codon:yes gene_type:complete